ncbi:MAG: endonuclease domain-containing protein, partial [Chloroflexota bacterium]|nr:endonuclease domain-containing protein [Chloroflexota bacterium]
LRQQTTPPEKKLWQYLRSAQLGVKFRSQHPINRYIVDFYARKAGLVVEVDGELAHTYLDQIKHDQERDKFMEGLGLKVLRFSASDVMYNIEGVISEIEYHLQESVPDNYSSGQWRYAKNIKIGDKIFIGENLNLCQVSGIREVKMGCDVIFLGLVGSDNFISDSFVFHV